MKNFTVIKQNVGVFYTSQVRVLKQKSHRPDGGFFFFFLN